MTFTNYRLPLPKLCQLVQATHPTQEDWEDAMPDDGGVDVNGIGMMLCEKLLTRHLKLTWEHHLITDDSLWLVGITKDIRSGDPADPFPSNSGATESGDSLSGALAVIPTELTYIGTS